MTSPSGRLSPVAHEQGEWWTRRPDRMTELSVFREGREVSVGLCPATRGDVVRPYMAVLPLRTVGLQGGVVSFLKTQAVRSVATGVFYLPSTRRLLFG